MVGGSLTCLGGAIHGKRLLTIIASFVMTISMIDLAFTNVLSPIFWMMLLVASGLVVAADVRNLVKSKTKRQQRSHVDYPNDNEKEGESSSFAYRNVMVASSVAYLVMAVLTVTHSHTEVIAGTAVTLNNHHLHSTNIVFAPWLLLIAFAIIAVFLVMCTSAFVQRKWAIALESIGMSAMLIAMASPLVL